MNTDRGIVPTIEEHAMTVRDIMSRRVATVALDDRLHVVKQIFDSSRFHHLLAVEDDGTLYGVVSDRDLLRAMSPFIGSIVETGRDLATLDKAVHQIMTRKPITLRPEASIADAIRVFLEHPVSCIPIVDEHFKPVGIVSWRDVLKSLPSGAA
jgi:acetoin utilization protein AcuB